MDLEHLNKSQVVLLTLFVSFVTSIATGIVTVSLMNQAPPQVAASVNHIIERTVEQVAAPVAAITPPSVKTVIVHDDDLAAQSIANVQKSVVRIVASSTPDILVARGIVIDPKGTVMTDRDSFAPDTAYEAILPDGNLIPIKMRPATSTSSFVFGDLSLNASTSVSAVTFADPAKLQLGQTVIRIGGTGLDTVGEGVIARLPQKDNEIEATVISATPGSVLTTIFGEVIGLMTSTSAQDGADFYSIPQIVTAASSPSSH